MIYWPECFVYLTVVDAFQQFKNFRLSLRRVQYTTCWQLIRRNLVLGAAKRDSGPEEFRFWFGIRYLAFLKRGPARLTCGFFVNVIPSENEDVDRAALENSPDLRWLMIERYWLSGYEVKIVFVIGA